MAGKSEKETYFEYADILDCDRPTFPQRKAMSVRERAAQFSPFAALRGYDDEIAESARITSERRQLSEEENSVLNEKLRILCENIRSRPEIVVTWFVADKKKSGGSYRTEKHLVRQVNLAERLILLENHVALSLDDIVQLEGAVFRERLHEDFL